MIGIDYLLLIGSVLIVLSAAITRASDNLGVPTLLLFLGIGMLAGSEGPGGIEFDDAGMAQAIGVVALVFILFSGGLDTQWTSVRPVALQAASLATVGVILTAVVVGATVVLLFDFSLLHGLLLGALISSTDAAAVFSVLRAKELSLQGRLKPLLELESGSNDPMAVFLTVGVIQLITVPAATVTDLVIVFFLQMGIGAAAGLGLGRLIVLALNRLKLSHDGIYPVFLLASAGLVYAVTSLTGGSGFLAVYLAGIVVGNNDVVQRKSLLRFFDGLAWLGQIGMFLALGLLVFPSHIVPVIGKGLLVAGVLVVLARPIGVFVALLPAHLNWREKAFVSWVGLRGAVPIILATFPLIAGVDGAETLFNLVFFTVVTSVLLQGWSLPLVARLLRVDAPFTERRRSPIEFAPGANSDTDLVDLIIPYDADVVGRSIVEIGMPRDSLIVLITRNEQFIVPSGGTVLEEGDTILALVNKENLPEVRSILSRHKPPDGNE